MKIYIKRVIIAMVSLIMLFVMQTNTKASENHQSNKENALEEITIETRAIGTAVKRVVISDTFPSGEKFEAQMDITYTYNDNNNFSIIGIVETNAKLISGPSEAYIVSAYAEKTGPRKFHVVMAIVPCYGGVPYYSGKTFNVF